MRGLALILIAASSVAGAQVPANDRAIETVVIVPASMPADAREALRVELQLSGRRVSLRVVDDERALASHAVPHVAWTEHLVLVPERDGTRIVRVGADQQRLEERVEGTAPAVVAVVAALLLELPLPRQSQSPSQSPSRSRSPSSSPSHAPSHSASASTEDSEPGSLSAQITLSTPALAPAASPASAEPPRSPPPREERIAWELLGGAIGAAALGTVGALIALESSPRGTDDGFPYWSFGLAIGGAVGTTAGALIAGRATGADGDPAWTILAGLAAGALSVGVLGLGRLADLDGSDGVDTAFTYLGTILAVALPPTLTILAFELTVPPSPRVTVRTSGAGIVIEGAL